MTIVCCLFNPFLYMIKTLSTGNIETHNSTDCVSIIPSCNRFETLLSCLNYFLITVSQICSFMLFLLILSILAPNSTPIVTSCLSRYRLSVNCKSKHDFPTPESPMMMYLNKNEYDILIFIISNFNSINKHIILFEKFIVTFA